MSSRRSSRRRDGNDGKQTLEIAKLGGRDHTLKLSKDPDTASKELFAYFREHFPGCTAIAKNAVIFNVGAGSKHSVALSPGVVTAYGGRTTCSAVKALSEGGSAPLREGLGGQGVWGRVGLPLGYSPPQAKLSAC